MEKKENDREKAAMEFIEKKQKEEMEKRLAQRTAYLTEISQSNIDDLMQKYAGSNDTQFILEFKKIEYLESIAYALNAMLKGAKK
jgi:S-adenosylmethionine synthetase